MGISLLTELMLMYYNDTVVDVVMLLLLYYFKTAFCLNCVFLQIIVKKL